MIPTQRTPELTNSNGACRWHGAPPGVATRANWGAALLRSFLSNLSSRGKRLPNLFQTVRGRCITTDHALFLLGITWIKKYCIAVLAAYCIRICWDFFWAIANKPQSRCYIDHVAHCSELGLAHVIHPLVIHTLVDSYWYWKRSSSGGFMPPFNQTNSANHY